MSPIAFFVPFVLGFIAGCLLLLINFSHHDLRIEDCYTVHRGGSVTHVLVAYDATSHGVGTNCFAYRPDVHLTVR